MKKLLSFVLLLVLLAACSAPAADPASAMPPAAQPGDDTQPDNTSDAKVSTPVDPALWEQYKWEILPYMQENHLLQKTWEGPPPITPVDPDVHDERWRGFEVTNIEKFGDITQLTVENCDNFYWNPYTGEQYISSIPEGERWEDTVIIEGEYSGMLSVGRSIVRVRRRDFDWEYLSCAFTPIENAGYTRLAATTESISSQLADSPPLRLADYDPHTVDYFYRMVASKRLIGGPEELTEYDLSALITVLNIDTPYSVYDENGAQEQTYVFDSSILRLMPDLTEVYVNCKISDYSVFADMHNLKRLSVNCTGNGLPVTAGDLASLRVGHTEILYLYDAEIDVLDLSNAGTVDALLLNSFFAAVGDFKGCDQIKTLYVMSTRTNSQLYNPENFPNVQNIYLEAYRDYPRPVSYSRLAEFDDSVTIDIALQYYGCDNDAVSSLIGISLRNVYLAPHENRPDFDPLLAESLTAEHVYWEEYPDFFSLIYQYE